MSAVNPLAISPPESHYLKDEEMSIGGCAPGVFALTRLLENK
jgi:hypothetical protein